MKWVGSLGLIKYNADAKNRPEGIYFFVSL